MDYPGRVAVIEMHIAPGYPLYNDEANNRKNYYEPPYPYGWLYYDGDRHGMLNYALWRQKITTRMAIPSPITISMWGDYSPIDGSGMVYVQFRNDSTESLTGRVIMVVTEDSLYYAGPNLDTIHNYVARDYLPDENGMIITIDPGDSLTVTQPFIIDTSWVERLCRIVAWMQNDSAYIDSTREVWQGGMINVSELIGINECTTSFPYTPETLMTTVFKGTLPIPLNEDYKIRDVTGRYIEVNDLKPGVYFIDLQGRITHKVVKIQ